VRTDAAIHNAPAPPGIRLMATRQSADTLPLPGSPRPARPSELTRSVLSLFLVIHFLCVFTVLGSTYLRSTLQRRLVSIFGAYTELLAFDPGQFTPYFYTHGLQSDNDAVFSLELYPAGDVPVAQRQLLKTVALPDPAASGLSERQRTIRLARQLAFFADPEQDRDDLAAEIARGVAGRVMRENGAQAAVLRCKRRLSQPLDLSTLYPEFPPNDPTAPAYDELVYEADVYFDEEGQVQAIRRQAAAEVAPRRTSGAKTQGSGARSQEPGAKRPEPGAKSPEPGTKSRGGEAPADPKPNGERGVSAP